MLRMCLRTKPICWTQNTHMKVLFSYYNLSAATTLGKNWNQSCVIEYDNRLKMFAQIWYAQIYVAENHASAGNVSENNSLLRFFFISERIGTVINSWINVAHADLLNTTADRRADDGFRSLVWNVVMNGRDERLMVKGGVRFSSLPAVGGGNHCVL